MRLAAIGLIALAVVSGAVSANARDGGRGDSGGRGSHEGRHEGRHESHEGRRNFHHHHHHFFFRDFAVIGSLGWPYYYYPYWIDEPGAYVYAPPPSQVQLGDPIPGQANCREFRTTIVVDNETQPAYGKACQQPDGTWLIAP